LRGHGRGSSLPRLRQGGLRVFHDTLSVAFEDIARSDLVVSDKAPADKLSSHGRSQAVSLPKPQNLRDRSASFTLLIRAVQLRQ